MSEMKKEFLSEFFGTFILLAFGTGVVAVVAAFPGADHGGWLAIIFGWGIAIILGVYTGQHSGAHLNPAVTIAFAVTNRLPWSKVSHYCIAQMLGAFCGAALVYLNYYVPIHIVNPLLDGHATAGIFTTFPAYPDNIMVGVIDQIIGTFFLLFTLLAIVDRLIKVNALWLVPYIVAAIILGIGFSFGPLHGYAINPARDLGPRLLITLVGYKNNGLTDGTLQFLVPIICPIIGGALGALVYDKTMGKVNKD